MDGYEKEKERLQALDVTVVAASVDVGDDARKVAAVVSFPVLEGVSRSDAESIGAWWEEKRGIIQPSEFVLDSDGKVMASTYSSGPIGRIAAADAAGLLEHLSSKK